MKCTYFYLFIAKFFLIYSNFSLTFILKNFYKSVSVSIFIKLHATLKELQDKVFVVRAVVYRSKNKGSCQNYICLKPDLLVTMIWSLPSEREPAFKAWKFPFPYPFSSTICQFANFFEVNKKKGSFSGIELTTLSLWYANFIETFRVTPINLLFCFFSLSSRIFDKLKRKIHKKSEVLLRLKQWLLYILTFPRSLYGTKYPSWSQLLLYHHIWRFPVFYFLLVTEVWICST